MPIEEFKDHIDALIRRIKSSKLRPGFKEILLPGEPELRAEMKRRVEGINLPERTWIEIRRIAEKKNISITELINEK